MRVNRGIRLTVILLSAGCSGLGFGCDAGRTAETPPASSTSASAQAQGAAAVTEAELDAYVKGIRREIEALRELGQDITWPAQYLRAGPQGAKPRAPFRP